MTTIDAAAARRFSPRLVLALGLVSLSLAGCSGGGSSLLSGDYFGSSIFGSATPAVAEAQPPPAPAPVQQPLAKIALAPIIGAPDTVARQIQQDFTSTVQSQRVLVAANKDERVDYTLRGYLVAAKEKNSTKVSYIWDVTDNTGKRVNRVTGEEVLPGGASKDPWAALTPEVAQSLAAKAANSFAGWIAAQSGSGTPVAAATPASSGTSTASVPDPAPKKKAAATPAAAAASTSIAAVVPRVTGAPGDGSQSLSQAIRQELTDRGVALADTPSASTYRVEGSVKIGEAKDNKQPIMIEWVVKDPQGKKLGTVSQRNEIPAGSLDGAWGATAQQAAGAAVQGIVKLLPGQRTASNG
ncbi:MAG: hypothetical protein NW223_12055 [Hyphomicrobiaceae bacterium]|nr:hypothetical protein [Hyphomicrobiaceae bacterium]